MCFALIKKFLTIFELSRCFSYLFVAVLLTSNVAAVVFVSQHVCEACGQSLLEPKDIPGMSSTD